VTKFPPNTKQAKTVDRCSLKRATEFAGELATVRGGPHINIRSPRLQPGKYAIGETKRTFATLSAISRRIERQLREPSYEDVTYGTGIAKIDCGATRPCN
jgi:hypothetical protein